MESPNKLTDHDSAATSEIQREVFALHCNKPTDGRLINFHELEQHAGQTFRWSEPVSMVRVALAAGDYRVEIDTGCLRGAEVDFRFQLHWNDHLISLTTITTRNGKVQFDVEKSMCNARQEQRLSISCRPLNGENGRRLLGMPVCSIHVFEVRSETAAQTISINSRPRKPSHPTKRTRSWFGASNLEPTIPIWQVRMPEVTTSTVEAKERAETPSCDRAVVAPCEINSRHGTGLLIKYLIKDFREVATVNSISCYNDDRISSRIHHYLPRQSMSRAEIYDQVFSWFCSSPPKEAYVVPHFESDLLIALALNDLFKTKICLHVMDDNCLFSNAIQIDVAAEAIEKSSLVLAISPEMKQAYEQRFGKRVWLLPPIVPDHLIATDPIAPRLQSDQPKPTWISKVNSLIRKYSRIRSGESSSNETSRGILIGNIWDKNWLDRLRTTIRESGLKVDWYSNNPEAVWLKESLKDLADDGIFLHEPLWDQDLVDELRCRPFAIMPSSELNGMGERESIARLSLPCRIPFIIATAQLPMIVLGSDQTAASKFITRFGLGKTVGYNGQELCDAVKWIGQTENQVSIRRSAFEIAQSFAAESVEEWIWTSLEKGVAVDNRFEHLFPAKPGEFSRFFDPEPPKNIDWSFRDIWQLLNRIKTQGFTPEVIVDVGASTGVWSWTAATIYPAAKFVLVDPMMSRYDQQSRDYYQRSLKSFELVEAALSDKCGETEILVTNDFYGSSLLKVGEKTPKAEATKVNVLTLDELARLKNLTGRTLLKVDVRNAEHLVLNGGLEFIRDNVDAVILELTLEREHPQAKTYREMLDFMDQLGFDVVDEMEGWRDPVTGRLEQKNSVFLRRELIAARKAA
ncbi:MAG: FkbM family methyltransferase [Pirellulaceae bacterium]